MFITTLTRKPYSAGALVAGGHRRPFEPGVVPGAVPQNQRMTCFGEALAKALTAAVWPVSHNNGRPPCAKPHRRSPVRQTQFVIAAALCSSTVTRQQHWFLVLRDWHSLKAFVCSRTSCCNLRDPRNLLQRVGCWQTKGRGAACFPEFDKRSRSF